MKFDVDDKNRCRLVCVKFHLNRCRFAVAVAKCLGGSLFWISTSMKFIFEFLYSFGPNKTRKIKQLINRNR